MIPFRGLELVNGCVEAGTGLRAQREAVSGARSSNSSCSLAELQPLTRLARLAVRQSKLPVTSSAADVTLNPVARADIT